MNPLAETLYKSQARLKAWLLGLLAATLLLTAVAIVSDWIELELLTSMRDQTYGSIEEIKGRADASDGRQMLIGALQLISSISIFVLWLVWIFKSNKMARALGAAEFGFSPGWSVGWYFIPIANLVQPYRALSRIIRATRSPDGDWKAGAAGMLPIAWWLSFWVDNIASRLSLSLAVNANGVEDMLAGSRITLFSDCTGFASYALMTMLVLTMFADQREAASRFARI